MTKRNKLIVGAVVVLGAYYLYDKNRKMKEVARLKAGAITKEVATNTSPTKSEIDATPIDLRGEGKIKKI